MTQPILPFSISGVIAEEPDEDTGEVYNALLTTEETVIGVSQNHPSLYWVADDAEEALSGIKSLVESYNRDLYAE